MSNVVRLTPEHFTQAGQRPAGRWLAQPRRVSTPVVTHPRDLTWQITTTIKPRKIPVCGIHDYKRALAVLRDYPDLNRVQLSEMAKVGIYTAGYTIRKHRSASYSVT